MNKRLFVSLGLTLVVISGPGNADESSRTPQYVFNADCALTDLDTDSHNLDDRFYVRIETVKSSGEEPYQIMTMSGRNVGPISVIGTRPRWAKSYFAFSGATSSMDPDIGLVTISITLRSVIAQMWTGEISIRESDSIYRKKQVLPIQCDTG